MEATAKTDRPAAKKPKTLAYQKLFLKRLQKAVDQVEKNYLDVGKLHSEAYHSGDGIKENSIWYGLGHHNFPDFVEKRTGWSVRRAYALLAVSDFIEEYSIPKADALAARVSKMSLIGVHAKQWELGRDEVMECIREARNKPWDEFVDWIQTRKEPEDRRKPGPVTQVMFLKFGARQRDWVAGILEKAREVVAVAEDKKPLDISREHAIEVILREWAEMKGLLKTEEQ